MTEAILEPILLSCVSKYKQAKGQDSEGYLWTHIFTFLCDYYQICSFFCQDANITLSNSGTIGRDLSKKHKLTLYQTHIGEPSYVDHKVLFKYFAKSYLYNNLGTDIQIL